MLARGFERKNVSFIKLIFNSFKSCGHFPYERKGVIFIKPTCTAPNGKLMFIDPSGGRKAGFAYESLSQ